MSYLQAAWKTFLWRCLDVEQGYASSTTQAVAPCHGEQLRKHSCQSTIVFCAESFCSFILLHLKKKQGCCTPARNEVNTYSNIGPGAIIKCSFINACCPCPPSTIPLSAHCAACSFCFRGHQFMVQCAINKA